MMSNDEFESLILRFEQVRKTGVVNDIAEFLEGSPKLSETSRSRVLHELICIDLEFGWRNPRANRPLVLEDYVERFPELGTLERLSLELIGEEYRVRCRWGDRPTHVSFLERFGERLGSIKAELSRIDEEIERESTAVSLRSPGRQLLGNPPESPRLSSDDFLLRRLIGSGAMGKVYEANHKKEGRTVAVKFLRKSFLDHPDLVTRFVEEAATISRLRHPKIVGTEGLGRTAGGSYFIVMDHVGGCDLSKVAARRTIEVGEAVRWMIDACDALEYAHDLGVVHCDLKPANLLIEAAGTVRVTDFGLARSVESHPRGFAIEGTAPFMAPEQVSAAWGPIDCQTDIYGVGAVLFALLAGRPPWVGRRIPDILAQILSARPVVSVSCLRPDLPQTVVDLCLRCLAKRKADRFSTIREVRAALEAITL